MPDTMDAKRALELRTLAIFRNVPAPVLTMASALLQDTPFSRGETLQPRDAVVPRIFFLRSGVVRVERDSEPIDIQPPAHLGLYYALSGRAAVASVVALTDVSCFTLDVRDVYDLFEDHFPLLRSSIREISRTILAETKGQLELPFTFAATRRPIPTTKKEFDLVDRLFFLRRMLAFPHVSVDGMASVARQLRTRVFAPGEPIWKRGEPAIDVTMVVRGDVEAASDADRLVHEGGGPVGGLEVFAQAPRWFDLTAKTEVVVLQTTYDAIFDMFEEHTEMGKDLVATLAGTVLRVRQQTGEMDIRKPEPVPEASLDAPPLTDAPPPA